MIYELKAYVESQLETCDSEDGDIVLRDLLSYIDKKLGPIEKRKKAFIDDLRPYLDKYGKDICNKFFKYWSEIDRGKKPKMRFEKETTWELSKRLERWYLNNK